MAIRGFLAMNAKRDHLRTAFSNKSRSGSGGCQKDEGRINSLDRYLLITLILIMFSGKKENSNTGQSKTQ